MGEPRCASACAPPAADAGSGARRPRLRPACPGGPACGPADVSGRPAEPGALSRWRTRALRSPPPESRPRRARAFARSFAVSSFVPLPPSLPRSLSASPSSSPPAAAPSRSPNLERASLSDASCGRQRRRLLLEPYPLARPPAQPCPARRGRRRSRGRTEDGAPAMHTQ